MTKRLGQVYGCLVAVTLSLASASCIAGSWLDSYIDNASYDAPSSFDGQKRGYFSAGGFSMRTHTSNDYPITIETPSLSVGCGGIDAFLGGFSFLNTDYLVAKGQKMLQVAPYFIVDMALKTMCKDCADTWGKAEALIDSLNNIQLDECKAMKPLVSYAFGQSTGQDVKNAWAEMTNYDNIKTAAVDLWQTATEDVTANNGESSSSDDTYSDLTEACNEDVKDFFAEGSMIDNIMEQAGMSQYASFVRGEIGDVTLTTNDTSMLIGVPVAPCAENRGAVNDILYGQGQTMDSSGNCSSMSESMLDIIAEKVDAIHSAIVNNTSLSSDTQSFINSSPLPIYNIVRTLVENDIYDGSVVPVEQLLAAAFTKQIFDDVFSESTTMARNVQAALASPTKSSSGECRLEIYAGPMEKFKALAKRLSSVRRDVNREYGQDAQVFGTMQQISNGFNRLHREAAKKDLKDPTAR